MAESFDPYFEWLGIGAAERPISLYRLLGLPPHEPDRAAIAAAVERQAALVRSRGTGAQAGIAGQVLAQIESARRTLLDPDAKGAYDAKLRARLAAEANRPVAASVPTPPPVARKLVRARPLAEPPPPPPVAAKPATPVRVGHAPVVAADDAASSRARTKRKNLLVSGSLVATVGVLLIAGIVLIVVRLKPKATAERPEEDQRPVREPLAAEDFLPAEPTPKTAKKVEAAAEPPVAARTPAAARAAKSKAVEPVDATPASDAAEPTPPHGAGADLARLIAADAEPAELRAAVEAGSRLEATDVNGRTPLRLAVMLGRAALVETLIELKANVNAADPLGETPLMSAAQRGDVAAVEALLAARAKADARTKAGLTPLLIAAHHGHADVVRALAAAHANLNQGNRGGTTPLMAAARAGQHAVVCTLLEVGAKVDAVDGEGQTALMYAAAGGQADTIDVLLDHGAALRAKSQRGATALSIALGAENAACARRLRDAGRNLAPDLNELD